MFDITVLGILLKLKRWSNRSNLAVNFTCCSLLGMSWDGTATKQKETYLKKQPDSPINPNTSLFRIFRNYFKSFIFPQTLPKLRSCDIHCDVGIIPKKSKDTRRAKTSSWRWSPSVTTRMPSPWASWAVCPATGIPTLRRRGGKFFWGPTDQGIGLGCHQRRTGTPERPFT